MQHCPKATEDPRKFAEKFNIVIQTYQPGFSNLYKLVHTLVGEGQISTELKLLTKKILKDL